MAIAFYWLEVIKGFNRHFISAVGDIEQLALWALQTNRKWFATNRECSCIKFKVKINNSDVFCPQIYADLFAQF
jgi:hypothetical protein